MRRTSPPPAPTSSSPHQAGSTPSPSSPLYTRMCYLVLRSLIVSSKAASSGHSVIRDSALIPGQAFESIHTSVMTSVWVSEALRTVCCLQSHVEALCLAAEDETASKLLTDPSLDSSCGSEIGLLAHDGSQVSSSDVRREVNQSLSLTERGALRALVGCLHVAVREGLTSRNPQTRSRAAHLLDSLRRLGLQPKVM